MNFERSKRCAFVPGENHLSSGFGTKKDEKKVLVANIWRKQHNIVRSPSLPFQNEQSQPQSKNTTQQPRTMSGHITTRRTKMCPLISLANGMKCESSMSQRLLSSRVTFHIV